ncbi:MAG TPA: type VI secretion system baseplate subunit TssG [Bryobacteraceae bacterium]|jgi:type VI secretion system protein ImpH
MAAPSGTENLALIRQTVEDRLFSEPYSFEFVQAVRLLHQFYPNRAAIGFFQPPASEVVRFGVRPSLSFPASEVHEIEQLKDTPPLMRVNFMGTIGPLGLLPLYYTELVAERLKERDRTLRDFLDIFHHRIISLFYRAWVKHHFPVQYERGGEGDFSYYLSAIIGLGTPKLQDRQEVADQSLRFYAGLFAQQPRSAEALKLMLRDFFGVPAEVEQFLGAWYRLEPDSQCNLDDAAEDSQMLGFGAVVGDEIWDPQSRVRIVIGPLSLRRYLDFLPSGRDYQLLRNLVRFFAGDEFDFEAQLILRREEVPACELGSGGDSAPQLGWVSWSSTRPMDYNPSQTILQL